jgi:hypothetical protein
MAATWRVIPPQRFIDELTTAGVFVPMIEITFEIIATGSQGTVKVSERDYTEAFVRQEIERVANAMIAVEGLSG